MVLNGDIISFTMNMCLRKMKFLEKDEISDYFWDSFKYSYFKYFYFECLYNV